MICEKLAVSGLQRPDAVDRVRGVLREVWGIHSVDEVDATRGEVTFTYDEQAASAGDFAAALQQCGYGVSAVGGGGRDGQDL